MGDTRKGYYELLYSRRDDPWSYKDRAIEQLRYLAILNAIGTYGNGKANIAILDVGCGAGNLTEQLTQQSSCVCAMDISENAISKLISRCAERGYVIEAKVGVSTAIPFKQGTFDVVLLADGIAEWKLSEGEIEETLNETRRILKEGGVAIFTDYLRPKEFDLWLSAVARSPLQVIEIRYLNDRLWYQFESWFKKIRHWTFVRKILNSLPLARGVCSISRFLGRQGSRHIMCIIRETAAAYV